MDIHTYIMETGILGCRFNALVCGGLGLGPKGFEVYTPSLLMPGGFQHDNGEATRKEN